MQQTLDAYGAGVLVNGRAAAGGRSRRRRCEQAFFDVNAAQQDAVRVQNEAGDLCEPRRARGAGRGGPRRFSRRKAIASRSVAEATGQACRFSQVYEEYRKAPDVIRERMFLETMERVLGGIDKIIIDQSAQRGRASCRIFR